MWYSLVTEKVLWYVFDLGFYIYEAPAAAPGNGTLTYMAVLNYKAKKDWRRDIVCWLILAAGLCFGQAVSIDKGFQFIPGRLTVGASVISLLLALVIFGPFMRWVRKKRVASGLLQVAFPFGFGVSSAMVAGKLQTLLKFY